MSKHQTGKTTSRADSGEQGAAKTVVVDPSAYGLSYIAHGLRTGDTVKFTASFRVVQRDGEDMVEMAPHTYLTMDALHQLFSGDDTRFMLGESEAEAVAVGIVQSADVQEVDGYMLVSADVRGITKQ